MELDFYILADSVEMLLLRYVRNWLFALKFGGWAIQKKTISPESRVLKVVMHIACKVDWGSLTGSPPRWLSNALGLSNCQ